MFMVMKQQVYVWQNDSNMSLLHEIDPGNNLEVHAVSVYEQKIIKLKLYLNRNYFKEITIILPISSSFKRFNHNCGFS